MTVDISTIVQTDFKTGIQRVVRSILQAWLLNPPNGWRIEPVYHTVKDCYRYARQFTAQFLDLPMVDLQDKPIDYAPGDIFFALDLYPHDELFIRNLRRKGIVVKFMVHDLIPVLHPEYFPKSMEDWFPNWLKVVGESDGAICVSKTTADELAEWMDGKEWQRLRPFTIEWNMHGMDTEDSVPTFGLPENTEAILSSLKRFPSFLMVGTLEPRKGHAQVLDAFDRLWQDGANINLVIVGKQGWKVDDLIDRLRAHPENGKHLFWLGQISDEYLVRLYGNSTCLIAASYAEGFGLPLVEAANYDLPIIARNIPVFREVMSEYAYYFDGQSSKTLAQAIQIWLQLYETGDYPKTEDMTLISWKESAQKLLRLLCTPDGQETQNQR